MGGGRGNQHALGLKVVPGVGQHADTGISGDRPQAALFFLEDEAIVGDQIEPLFEKGRAQRGLSRTAAAQKSDASLRNRNRAGVERQETPKPECQRQHLA